MSSATPRAAPVGATAMHSTAVGEVMHPGIMACTSTASVAEVAQVMASCQVHCVAVAADAEDGIPFVSGVVTDVELLKWATGGSTHLPAGAVVSEPAMWVAPTASVHEAAQIMADNNADHLLVGDPSRRAPLGIISALDVARVLARGAGSARTAARSAR